MMYAIIEFHADDYGLFPSQSLETLDCYQNGCLNAVSIMPNSPYLSECMEMLQPYQKDIKTAIYLNFMEGHSVCAPEQVSLLTNGDGIFDTSFGKLLLAGILPNRKEYQRQLRREIHAQIHAVTPFLDPSRPLRIDGHAHYHMLPVVFDSLIQVLEDEKLNVEYIRIPREKLPIYLKARKALEGIKLINLVKVMILNLLAIRNRQKHREYLEHMEDKLFLGVALSGNMTRKNVDAILPGALRETEKTGQGIEILAHPGGVYDPAETAQLTHPDDKKFLTDDLRKREKEMFCTLKNRWVHQKESEQKNE